MTIRITTGDYRLEEESFASPPPDLGELIVATPERFDAVLRNPANAPWVNTVGCVCADEAHLIGTAPRGLTVEYLLTALKCLAAPPRLILLSGSLGDVAQARAWLEPCDVTRVTERVPPLRKEVWQLSADGEDGEVDRALGAFARDVLQDASAQLLVFVYQTRSAEKVARQLRQDLDGQAGPDGPLGYHAHLNAAQREAMRLAFTAGRSRCLVSTTALGLGVNLPVTHVLVRDTTFPGVGRVSATDLLQMMGRAGRGDRAGHAVALVRPNDGWDADELASALREESVPGLVSVLEQPRTKKRSREPRLADSIKAGPILTLLLRHQERGLTLAEAQAFCSNLLGGRAMAGAVGALLSWLCDPGRCLAYADEYGRYHATVLGRHCALAALPLDVAAGAAQLIRDLLSADDRDHLLCDWQGLDHLILLELLNPRPLPGRRFGEGLADQLDGWMEGSPERESLLYREWIRGTAYSSRAGEVLGSLGISIGGGSKAEEASRQTAHMAVFRAAILIERASGLSAAEVACRWGVSGLEGVEERWRDDTLWLLAGLSRMLEIRTFYYHLREVCAASASRIRRVNGFFRQMRRGIFDLQEQLKYCSPLGPMLRSLRRASKSQKGSTVGVQTIRRLEGAGVRTIADLAQLSLADLVSLKIRPSLAEQIRAYVKGRPG
jgi:hypothetical protein